VGGSDARSCQVAGFSIVDVELSDSNLGEITLHSIWTPDPSG
jgi:hypothetical protein